MNGTDALHALRTLLALQAILANFIGSTSRQGKL